MISSIKLCLIVGFVLVGVNVNYAFEPMFSSLFPEARDLVEVIDVLSSGETQNEKYRVDCMPDFDEQEQFCPASNSNADKKSIPESGCLQRGCTYDSTATDSVPTCYIPLNKGGYGFSGYNIPSSNAIQVFNLTRLPSKTCVSRKRKSKRSSDGTGRLQLSDKPIERLSVTVSRSGNDKLRITIRDLEKDRYEVPVPIQWTPDATQSVPPKMNFQLTRNSNSQVGFRVTRANNSTVLFDTSSFAHGFIYDDQFIQFITTIPSQNAYGFGENTHRSFRHILKDSRHYAMFARDQWPTGRNQNLYGTHPFYMVIEPNGLAFGVFIFNSNAQDYKFGEYGTDKAMLTYRAIGGILDIMFFAGPNPEDVVRQYQSVIGQPYMPPYWALGFQLSRYGFNNLQNMEGATNRTLNAGIPLDVVYGDIDYFDHNLDFTYHHVDFKGLPQFIDRLHTEGMKFITILDPAINSEEPNYKPYLSGQAKDIWIKWPQNENPQFNETKNRNMLGYVWPYGKTVFPDFFNPNATDWWINETLEFHKIVKFDGLWIDMNEPANFDTNMPAPFNWNRTMNKTDVWSLHCPVQSTSLDTPFYKTAACGQYLSDKTLCMIAEQVDGNGKVLKHYDVHNLYGWTETIATLKALRAMGPKRSIIISRSTFPTSGTMSGHWLGDNASKWKDLKFNIIGMLEFNLFGIPYIGADICGFIGNTTDELCQRWMQLGSFNPFFRNHNGIDNIDQDPGLFPPNIVASNKKAVLLRYALNPFLYTLFHRVHVSGGTVIRSMAHVFSNDANCWDLDEQFLWDSSLLIAPVISEGEIYKNLYLPMTELWYDYYDGQNQTVTGHKNVSAPFDFIPLYLRGGSIIPHQYPAMNTVLSRKNKFYLKVALDQRLQASGDMFWDDGESLDTYKAGLYNYFFFSFNKNRLIIEPWTFKYNGMDANNAWNDFEIFGYPSQPTKIVWNGEDLQQNSWTFNATTQVLRINGLGLALSQKHRLVFL